MPHPSLYHTKSISHYTVNSSPRCDRSPCVCQRSGPCLGRPEQQEQAEILAQAGHAGNWVLASPWHRAMEKALEGEISVCHRWTTTQCTNDQNRRFHRVQIRGLCLICSSIQNGASTILFRAGRPRCGRQRELQPGFQHDTISLRRGGKVIPESPGC